MERPEICQDLRQALYKKGPPSEEQMKRYFRQFLEANINIEECNVLHRDLKRENIL